MHNLENHFCILAAIRYFRWSPLTSVLCFLLLWLPVSPKEPDCFERCCLCLNMLGWISTWFYLAIHFSGCVYRHFVWTGRRAAYRGTQIHDTKSCKGAVCVIDYDYMAECGIYDDYLRGWSQYNIRWFIWSSFAGWSKCLSKISEDYSAAADAVCHGSFILNAVEFV